MKTEFDLKGRDFKAIAAEYETEISLLKALCRVESEKKKGFLKNGRPIILFEGHIFWYELKRKGIDPNRYCKENPNILYPNWDKTKYRGGMFEYIRLVQAMAISKTAALRSVSWGMFHMLGLNHELCNEPTIEGFVVKMSTNEAEQLRLSLNYIHNAGILPLLKNHQWTDFACLYNGPGFEENHYDERLRDEYIKIVNK